MPLFFVAVDDDNKNHDDFAYDDDDKDDDDSGDVEGGKIWQLRKQLKLGSKIAR